MLLTLLVAALSPSLAAAQEIPKEQALDLLRDANAAFREAHDHAAEDPEAAQQGFERAVLRYKRLIDAGYVNGKLYYNLGNAYLLSGDLGRAILNYRRAMNLRPDDPNLHQNLAYARSMRIDRIPPGGQGAVMQTLFFWHFDFSPAWRFGAGAAAWIVAWGCLAAALGRRGPWRSAAAVAFIVSILLLGSVGVEAAVEQRLEPGVIVVEEVVARMGDDESYEPSFEDPLHAGAEFELIESRGGWWRIALADARTCWIPALAGELVSNAPGIAGDGSDS
jgi:tetratricopeptide (TPR) repeat protein